MPYRCKSRSKSKSKHTRKNKRKACITRKRRGGGCGCGQQQPQQRLFGGSLHLSEVPKYSYYPYQSDLTNDPIAPANLHDARFMGDYSRVSGGKNKRNKRRGRKTRGGSNFFSNLYTQLANSGSGMNYINSFGALNGAINQSALVTGTGGVVDGSVTSQPVMVQPYGFPNPPLA